MTALLTLLVSLMELGEVVALYLATYAVLASEDAKGEVDTSGSRSVRRMSEEFELARKHTRFIFRDLPQLVSRSIGLLLAKWHDQDKRIAAYKEANITDLEAHDLVIRATDVGVCSNRLIPPVLHEWRGPRHDAFEQRNVWSLFNAFTESLKEGALAEPPKRTEALHGLLDTHVGLSA
jgi:hypothetical protein